MAKDSNGLTPFMLAVTGRGYQAALILLNVITTIARQNSVDIESERRTIHRGAQRGSRRRTNPGKRLRLTYK